MALSAQALTILTTLKQELGISTSTDDTYLEQLINAYSDAVIAYCGRSFHYSAAVVDTLPGHVSMFLNVKRPPIASITSISFNGSAIDSANFEIHDAGAGLIRFHGGVIWTAASVPNIERDQSPGSERNLYTVTYAGGYVTPQQAGTRSLPYDIEQAVIMACTAAYRNRGADPSIKSESLLSASVAYSEGDSYIGLSNSIKALLAPYARGYFA